MKPKVAGKGRRKAEQKDGQMPQSQTSPKTEDDDTRKKTVGHLFLAVLFSVIFWNSYWFLSKFLLLFVIVYVAYIVAKSRF